MEKRLSIFIFFLFIALFLRLFVFYYTKTYLTDGQFLNFKSTISSSPKTYSNYQNFTVETQKGERILVKTKPSINYQYGDNLELSGNIKIKVLKNNSYLSMDYPSIKIFTSNNLALVNFIRQKISDTFENALSQDDSALLEGIVFGIKENMSQNFLSQLKTVGVMHVIAASGMNVTLTAGFIFYIFSIFLKRQIATVITILAVVFYAFIAGLQASIIRASIMAIIAFTAQGIGRQVYSLYGLMLTAFIMLFVSPQFLTDIGFQLSFLATFGILILPNLFSRWKNLISTDFFTTISAQIATFPIIVSNFGTYSIWSIVVNVLVLWTVPIIMILGSFAAIFSVFEPLSKIFLYLCIPLLYYFEQVVKFFAGLGGVVNFDSISWPFIFSYYLFLSSVYVFIKKNR